MRIVKVELKEVVYLKDTGMFEATLLLDADMQRFSLRCRARGPEDLDRRRISELLLEDALRQIERMPEHRGAADRITVAADALPGTPGLSGAA